MTQAAATRRVLVCENRSKPGMGMAGELAKFARDHHFEIVTATSREAALRLLQAQPFAIALIDVGRESGEARALLRTIGDGLPSLPLFVFNGFLIPGIAEKAREYEQVQYCENPGDLTQFISLILEGLSGKKKGTIEGILLTNFLDWLNNEKLSGQVVVSSGSKKGVLFFQAGRLIGASSGDTQGGQTALAEISTWEKVTVEIKEGPLPKDAAFLRASSPAPAPRKRQGFARAPQGLEGSDSNIETLRLTRKGKTIVLHIKELKLLVAATRDMLSDALLRMDIFLSMDGRSLAGWNSHPLACSVFAGITRSLGDALEACRFPALGRYYMLDLAQGQLLLVLVCGELHIGMLLASDKFHLGLLTNVILPKAAKALNDSYTVERHA